ncbi:Short chain aldehyde dehydrogenase 1-like protein [Drosera capensis]
MNSFSLSAKLPIKRLEGKVAVITGAASGIGACTAKLFVHHGATVIVADVQDDLGQAFCQGLSSKDISYIHCDITNEDDVENLVDTIMSRYKRLDIMYSNAGIAPSYPLNDIVNTESVDFKRVIDVNLYGGFLCAKYAAKAMIPAQKGVILFTASTAAIISGVPHAYTVSKVAIVGLARNLCEDLGKYGIRVNCVSPSYIPTPLILNVMDIEKSLLEKTLESSLILKGAMVEEEDVANMALFLASDESKVISGQNFVLDGGYSTTNPTFHMKLQEAILSSKL